MLEQEMKSSNAFKNEVPNEYKSLVRDDRIIAPCKSTFNVGKINGNYFDNILMNSGTNMPMKI